MKNAKLGDVIAFVLRSMNEETRQTDEEAEAPDEKVDTHTCLGGICE